ncbi:MAG TPA: Asp-tRNA(Asn)/Glu-tRNA(Gln) amidotransferase subunit GatA [Saprospiraceae bacterium]|nr:Asp-tRNA(Asn)/Glu-tRNA(Gln) amidotransferase subunit GatA [Saprospiraceae bacterium]
MTGSWQEIQSNLSRNEISLSDIVRQYIQNCHSIERLNAYVEVFEEEALSRAQYLDNKKKNFPENTGKLFGMVISLKDNINYKDHECTAGSKILQGYRSVYHATAVQRLLDEDAIIIGRTNCDEFAMGSGTDTSYYGATGNGEDNEKVPGGSSGGAAVSVQMNTCLVALGSDTGGSVRQPAAFCNIIGFKPTYGSVSRYGLIAYASSFDQIGLLSKDHNAIETVMEVIGGYDPLDSTSLDGNNILPVPISTKSNYKIAYLKAAIDHPSLSQENKDLFSESIEKMKKQGHWVEGIDFEFIDYLVPTYYILTTAEASSNLNRYDGIRYGYRSKSQKNIQELYEKTRSEGFGIEVKRRIILGTFVLSEGYFDAYYRKAQAARRLIKDSIDQIFERYDFIILPTVPDRAWTKGSFLNDPVKMYLSDIYTVLANLSGIPSVSLPYPGQTGLGLQILAGSREEKKLFIFLNNILILA